MPEEVVFLFPWYIRSARIPIRARTEVQFVMQNYCDILTFIFLFFEHKMDTFSL